MTPQARKELKRAAEAAIEAEKTHSGLYPAGVWHVVEYGDEQSPGICVHSGDAWRVCFMATIQSQKDYEHQMAKAVHIAQANPTAILSLLEALEEKDGEIERLRKDNADLSAVAATDTELHLVSIRALNSIRTERDALRSQNEELREALGGLVSVIEAAGVHNLSNGVQLGPTVWFVKCSDALNRARAATQEGDDV